jgi:hypothetical protein
MDALTWTFALLHDYHYGNAGVNLKMKWQADYLQRRTKSKGSAVLTASLLGLL